MVGKHSHGPKGEHKYSQSIFGAKTPIKHEQIVLSATTRARQANVQIKSMAFEGLKNHLCAEADNKIHFVVCPHVGGEHHHLFTHLAEMDTQFIAGIKTPKALMRRVSTSREYGIYVIDLTHVVRKRRLAQLLQAVETVKDGHRYTSCRACYNFWMAETPKIVVFCRCDIDQRLLGHPPGYNIEKWKQWSS